MDLSVRYEIAQQLVEASWEDPSLKEKLLSNPKATLQELLDGSDGKWQLPDYLTVKFIEEAPGEITFVLPQNPDDEVLSEEQLALAAGGKGLKWPPFGGGGGGTIETGDIGGGDCGTKKPCIVRIGCNRSGATSPEGSGNNLSGETGTKFV